MGYLIICLYLLGIVLSAIGITMALRVCIWNRRKKNRCTYRVCGRAVDMRYYGINGSKYTRMHLRAPSDVVYQYVANDERVHQACRHKRGTRINTFENFARYLTNTTVDVYVNPLNPEDIFVPMSTLEKLTVAFYGLVPATIGTSMFAAAQVLTLLMKIRIV